LRAILASCLANAVDLSFVLRGLDPRIHSALPPGRSGEKWEMDCRVKPGNEGEVPSIPLLATCGVSG
jgi:hypothetical protein